MAEIKEDHSGPESRPIDRKIQAGLICSEGCPSIARIFGRPQRERIERRARLLPLILSPQNFDQHREEAARIEILFATWGVPPELLTPSRLPSLRAIFYGGGTIKSFGVPLLKRGIHIITAKAANALCVAQFCLGQITLSCKGYFRNTRMLRRAPAADSFRPFTGAGLYGEKIALLGMGAVARELLTLLRPFQLQVMAVDPYLTTAEADKLGVRIVTIEEAFAEAYVISNHLPDLPELQGIIHGKLLASMRPDATFLNTGRGAQVREAELIEVARSRPDLTFLLDVTEPEPPPPGSLLYDLPNVQLSSHIAGALNDDLLRLGDCLIEEFERFCAGQPLRYAEKLADLDRIA
jgi:phosphoglycerate dehydrogenase-like enzyme